MAGLLSAAMAVLLSSGPVQASSAPLQVAGDVPVDKQDAGEMICKRYKVLGSRLSNRKVCKTAEEWRDAREENAAVLREQRGAAGGPQPGNSGG